MGWTSDLVGRKEARMSTMDYETKPLDPTLIVKSLGRQREKELRSEIREAYLSDI